MPERSAGAVAAGHIETAAAARMILEAGGNAFDAAIAAELAACVAEPVLTSLGGGGFLTIRTSSGQTRVYDFFTQTPCRRRPAPECDFFPVLADFGPATQEFHIGMGSIATPGVVRGLFRVHRDLCSLPMTVLAQPAIDLARRGVTLTPFQQYLFSVVRPILCARPEAAAIFCRDRETGELLRAGDVCRQPALADTIEALAREGERLFYEGELGQRLVDGCSAGGGHLERADLQRYKVVVRQALELRYHAARIYTNPAPSCGGPLIGLALALLQRSGGVEGPFGSTGHLARLARIMETVDTVRRREGVGVEPQAALRVLSPAIVQQAIAALGAQARAVRGTTHISVIDHAGNVASLTASNGEGAGYVLPGSGIMMNNMLGEADINPSGFHEWPADTRMSSMMSPSVMVRSDGDRVALGSGGSNRIRSAILQVILNLIDFEMSPRAAVDSPRIHFEDGLLSVERADLPDQTMRELIEQFPRIQHWGERNLFFGGTHVVCLDPRSGEYSGAGDGRRHGHFDIAA
jgi:gamma-glutamyltranspeptidase/glutathione hydrolase